MVTTAAIVGTIATVATALMVVSMLYFTVLGIRSDREELPADTEA